MWIDRALQQRLLALAKVFPAVLITGPRQTGKTSLIRHCWPGQPIVTLDLPSAAQLAEQDPTQLLAQAGTPALIDEVQYAPGLFRYLKIRIDQDRTKMGRFIMTGSQKFALMEHASESLAGRVGILELDTLSSLELRSAGMTDGLDLLWRGGFPELYRQSELSPRDFYRSYLATYLERDVRPAVHAGSLRDFERFLRICATQSGQLLNYAAVAGDLGVAATTVKSWISILEASNQIILLEPWFGNLRKRMVKTPKLYFRDTGLLAFLLGFDSADALAKSAAVGAIWETFVVGQILRQLEVTGTSARLFFYRDAHGNDVDLLLERDAKLQLIEVKWTEAFTPPRPTQIQKVASQIDPAMLAAQHLLVARPQQDYPLSTSLKVSVVNGFSHQFI